MAIKTYFHGSVGPLYYDDTQDIPGVPGVKQSPLYFPDGAGTGLAVVLDALGRAIWGTASGGTPAAHALSHASGQSDALDLATLGGTLDIANGGTGSGTQNFVDLTTNQTVGGIKTFSASTLPLSNTDVTIAGSGRVSFTSQYTAGVGGSVFRFDPICGGGTEAALVSFLRQTNTSGSRSVSFFKGDGSSTSYIGMNCATGELDAVTILAPTIQAGVSGTTRGILRAVRGTGTNTPGYVQLESRSGTNYYFWATDAGALRHHTSAPTADTDGANVPSCSRSFILSAASLIPGTTGGCGTPAQKEAGTSLANYYTASFDKDTANVGYWTFNLPDDYDGGTVVAFVTWECTGGAASKKVDFEISAVAYADNTAITTAFGTMQASIDTWLHDDYFHISPATSAITIGGTPAAGNLCCVRLRRDATDATDDDLAANALVSCVRIKYTPLVL